MGTSKGKNRYCLIYCPCSQETEALKISEILLQEKLIACANLYPGVISRYWWEGKIETSSECVAIFKTHADLFTQVQKTIEKNHSYTNPAILKLPLEMANASFLKWIDDSVLTNHNRSAGKPVRPELVEGRADHEQK
jgi:periplasmic divalent cation tolerance protein